MERNRPPMWKRLVTLAFARRLKNASTESEYVKSATAPTDQPMNAQTNDQTLLRPLSSSEHTKICGMIFKIILLKNT